MIICVFIPGYLSYNYHLPCATVRNYNLLYILPTTAEIQNILEALLTMGVWISLLRIYSGGFITCQPQGTNPVVRANFPRTEKKFKILFICEFQVFCDIEIPYSVKYDARDFPKSHVDMQVYMKVECYMKSQQYSRDLAPGSIDCLLHLDYTLIKFPLNNIRGGISCSAYILK